MQIEERTVSKVGGSSLMVTLPKGWCRFHGLGPGSKVLVTSNGELRIRPKLQSQK
jgi:phosphate uptake regulator